MVTTAMTALLTTAPLAFLVLQDWYVDVNAPGCGTGTGTEIDPFCAIMAAVAAAAHGDTIQIAPGTYFENLFLTKDLSLVGSGGAQVTIVDGGGVGRVVHVLDARVSLTELTLTNGVAATGYGGGLYAEGTGYADDLPFVRLTSCTVRANSARSGGGIGVYEPAGDGLCEVVACSVEANTASEMGGGLSGGFRLVDTTVAANSSVLWGGGVAGSGEILDSLIAGNLAHSGGGILVGQSLTLMNSSVTANEAGFGGGLFVPPPPGGVLTPPPTLDLTASRVESNVASYRGGGLLAIGGDITITSTTVVANSALAGDGGGIASYGAYLTLANALVVANTATTYGGGLSGQFLDLSITNSTVALNTGGGIGGHDIRDNSYVPGGIQNSIFRENGGSAIDCSSCGSLTVEHSLVQGGWPGLGNLDADPLFVDPLNGDYRLLSTSPCIDAGDNSAVPLGLTTDLRGVPRFIDDPLTPDSGLGAAPVVDMGAYEFFRRLRDARGVPVMPAPLRSVP
jgi:hypothetical protein